MQGGVEKEWVGWEERAAAGPPERVGWVKDEVEGMGREAEQGEEQGGEEQGEVEVEAELVGGVALGARHGELGHGGDEHGGKITVRIK